MTNVRLHEILSPIVESDPAMEGFEAARELVWVDNSHPPVRPVLAFERMKGGELWPFYGLSIDFVPVVVRGRAIMRAGPKSVKLDVRIDPRDHLFGVSFMWGPDAAVEDLQATLPVVLARAAPFWIKYGAVASLADAVRFEEDHTTAIAGLGVENYVQAGFARPYLLAAAGQRERAVQLWNAETAYSGLDETGRKKAQEQFETVINQTFSSNGSR